MHIRFEFFLTLYYNLEIKMKTLLQLLASIVIVSGRPAQPAPNIYSHAEIEISLNDYKSLGSNITEWLKSNDTEITKYSKHVRVVELEPEDMPPNPQLKFMDEEGEEVEQVHVTHIPMDMLTNLIKDKKWAYDKW